MRDIVNTLRYFARERSVARWIRLNLIASFITIVASLLWLYSASYLALTESNIEKYQAYISERINQAKAQKSYQRDGDKVAGILKSMEQRYSQPAMVQKIERLAQSSGVAVNSQKYRALTGNKKKSWQIDISAQGRYAGLKSFLGKLSSLRGIAIHEKVKLSQSNTSKQLVMKVQLLVFQK